MTQFSEECSQPLHFQSQADCSISMNKFGAVQFSVQEKTEARLFGFIKDCDDR